MHPIHTSILEEFRRNPSRQYSTTDMVQSVFKDEYAQIAYLLQSSDRQHSKAALQQKAKLHRKLLYHINKLVDEHLLSIADIRGRGEKLFQLALEHGELTIREKGRQIVIIKTPSVGSSLDRYAERKLLTKHRPETWLSKQHAIMLDGFSLHSPEQLLERLEELLPKTSDVLAINRFDNIIKNTDAIQPLFAQLSTHAEEYDVSISLLINLDRMQNSHFLNALAAALPSLSQSVTFVFSLSPRTAGIREEFLRDLLVLFARSHRTISFKNTDLYHAPLFYGSAGAYTFTEEDFAYFKKRVRGISDSCVIGNLGVVVDIKRHFENGGSISDFRKLIHQICHGLFESDEQKRRQHRDSLQELERSKAHFRVANHYLRFWNGHLLDDNREFTFDLLESVQHDIDDFCQMQETIFKSCGLPIRFRIQLASSFINFDPHYFSEKWYRKTIVSSAADFEKRQMKLHLRERERLFKLLKGADRLRFFIDPGTPRHELVAMVRHLLNTHNIPCFTFNFRGKSGNLTLNQFLEATDV